MLQEMSRCVNLSTYGQLRELRTAFLFVTLHQKDFENAGILQFANRIQPFIDP